MQPQYRGYAHQTPSRGSHGNARKGGIGPMISQGHHHAPQLTQAQIQAQAQAQQMATELAKRRSRKPTDKNMPDAVEEIIIGDGVQKYKDLRDFERRLDATMTRKRLDIIDSIGRNAKRTKTLRIWITNTVEDQPWQSNLDSLDLQSHGTPSYRVKIEGRLLDGEEDLEVNGTEEASSSAVDGDKMDEDPKPNAAEPSAAKIPRPRLSAFFKEMTVEYPPHLSQSAETTVHWKKPEPPASRQGQAQNNAHHLPAGADFDELTFKRAGDQNINIVIKLTRHEEPEKYLLSDDLAEIVDMKEATRTEVTMGLWEYIKLMGLQEEDEKRNFRCDDLLRKITNRETGYLPNLNEYVQPHLSPVPPIQLPYTVRVDQAFHQPPATQSPPSVQATIYDIQVSVDDSLRTKMLPFIINPSYSAMLKEVGMLDDQLSLLVQAIQHSKAKQAFLTQMARDPVGFTKSWISSQKRDLEYIMGEASRGGGEDALGDEWRRAGGGVGAGVGSAGGALLGGVGGEGSAGVIGGGGRMGGADGMNNRIIVPVSPWDTGNARESVTMMLSKGVAPPANNPASAAAMAAAAAAQAQR